MPRDCPRVMPSRCQAMKSTRCRYKLVFCHDMYRYSHIAVVIVVSRFQTVSLEKTLLSRYPLRRRTIMMASWWVSNGFVRKRMALLSVWVIASPVCRGLCQRWQSSDHTGKLRTRCRCLYHFRTMQNLDDGRNFNPHTKERILVDSLESCLNVHRVA